MTTYHVGDAITYTFPLSTLYGGVIPNIEATGTVTAVAPGGMKGPEVELSLMMPRGPWGPAAQRKLTVYASDQHLRAAR